MKAKSKLFVTDLRYRERRSTVVHIYIYIYIYIYICLHRQFGDGDSVFLHNVGKHLPVYTKLQLEVLNRKTPFLIFTGLIFFSWGNNP